MSLLDKAGNVLESVADGCAKRYTYQLERSLVEVAQAKDREQARADCEGISAMLLARAESTRKRAEAATILAFRLALSEKAWQYMNDPLWSPPPELADG